MAMILSPAGNMDMLVSAINNNAQSVYLGLDAFNARQKVDNFTVAQLPEVISYCHVFGVKVYVAVNTSIKQGEFARVLALLDSIYSSNADGAILTDIALIDYCHNSFDSSFEIVASTQLNVNNRYGAKFLKQLGVTTVVVARETSYKDILEIRKEGLKVECFAHGAMCVCQSGQCLFSSIVGGNSGNRGLCAQPCRKFYSAHSGGKQVASGYLLSPKDLCSIDNFDKLSKLADVLKIEGRNRRSQYSGGITKIYTDRLSGNTDDCMDDIKMLFNRGNYLSEQYLSGGNGDIIYPKAQGHIGFYVGKLANKKLKTGTYVTKGDAFKVMRKDIEVGNGVVLESGAGSINVSLSDKCKDGDSVHITTSVKLIEKIDKAKRKIDIDLCVHGKVGEKLVITAKYNNITIAVQSDKCQQALKPGNIEENISKQLRKTGNTYYHVNDIAFDIGDIYMPLSIINELRRNLLDGLTTKIISSYNSTLNRLCKREYSLIESRKDDTVTKKSVMVVCNSVKEVSEIANNKTIDYIIVKAKYFDKHLLEDLSRLGNNIYVDMPPFADIEYVSKLLSNYKGVGVVANNVGAVQLAKELNIKYIVGAGCNVYNAYSAKLLAENQPYIFSQELTLEEVAELKDNCNGGHAIICGDITLMKLVHCPYKACGYNCGNCENVSLTYIDRHGSYPIVCRYFGRCCFELNNGLPLSVGNNSIPDCNIVVQYNKNTSISNYYDSNSIAKLVNYSEKYTKGRLFDKVN